MDRLFLFKRGVLDRVVELLTRSPQNEGPASRHLEQGLFDLLGGEFPLKYHRIRTLFHIRLRVPRFTFTHVRGLSDYADTTRHTILGA